LDFNYMTWLPSTTPATPLGAATHSLNTSALDHFSYQNLEKGLIKIKILIEKDQWHPTFIIHTLHNHLFENLLNQKIVSLISFTFLNLTPCIVFVIKN